MKKFLLALLLLLTPVSVYAQNSGQEESITYKGSVAEVKEVPCGEMLDPSSKCFQYVVYVDELEEEVETISSMSETGESKFKIGDKVYIASASNDIEGEVWSISGFIREGSIFMIFAIFALIAILVAGKQGIASLLSLAITIGLIYGWAVPRMLDGGNIILLGLVTVAVSLVINMYLSHGFNLKATVSTVSTLVGIGLVALLALLFTALMRVDGTGSEDAFILMSQTGGSIDLGAVFFVSILIGAMGVLDDVVMSQVSSIQEIYTANPKLTPAQLFKQSMNIGRDHISTMVNTLFIAYAGSSLALVMLLTYNSGGVGNILRIDSIAEEIVRTMAASLGILLVVPIASFLASNIIYRKGNTINREF